MASFKNADPKNDKIAFVAIPEWAKDLDWEYVSAILAFFMTMQLFEQNEPMTEVEVRDIISASFKEDTERKTDFIMELFEKNHVFSDWAVELVKDCLRNDAKDMITEVNAKWIIKI